MAIDVPGWRDDGQALAKTFERDGFDGAIAFVNAVAAVANRLNHHPDIAISWNRVTVRTWSHDANAITERDAELARAIDAL
ncbi:MAG TPA: 4a-hydroxytetrahydrobiopterin dehydratase [Candidatus Elarobacter sp.]|jgi:4a-hydroxytetrahydrobiopterin dehydratase|nr:4a-hydroxytetrahydrobiopterin dehydratase [Candidatus Elarobacter sp.]